MRSRISTKDYYNRNIEKERERHRLLYYKKKGEATPNIV